MLLLLVTFELGLSGSVNNSAICLKILLLDWEEDFIQESLRFKSKSVLGP